MHPSAPPPVLGSWSARFAALTWPWSLAALGAALACSSHAIVARPHAEPAQVGQASLAGPDGPGAAPATARATRDATPPHLELELRDGEGEWAEGPVQIRVELDPGTARAGRWVTERCVCAHDGHVALELARSGAGGAPRAKRALARAARVAIWVDGDRLEPDLAPDRERPAPVAGVLWGGTARVEAASRGPTEPTSPGGVASSARGRSLVAPMRAPIDASGCRCPIRR